MKNVPVGSRHTALVDDCDYERVSMFSWYLMAAKNGRFYAYRQRPSFALMHRFILWLNDRKQGDVDHKNHDGLDNRRDNLRICSRKQNQANRRKNEKHWSSQYKGVAKQPHANSWIAQISVDNRTCYLGSYPSEFVAALIYDEWARLLHGEFAHTNF